MECLIAWKSNANLITCDNFVTIALIFPFIRRRDFTRATPPLPTEYEAKASEDSNDTD